MIIVDRGVWVDYFTGNKTDQARHLDSLLGKQPIGTSELIYTDVLRGFIDDKDFETAKKLFSLLSEVDMVTPRVALKAAENSRILRGLGVSVRNTMDLLIASYCIDKSYPLLYVGQNYIPFENHLGLINEMNRQSLPHSQVKLATSRSS